MKKLVIAGGSGFLGDILIEHFKNSVDRIYILTRREQSSHDNVCCITWDAKNFGDWVDCLENADAVINLTGKSVDCRYTQKNKKLILSSRIASTKILGEAIKNLKNPPTIWINSSTATIYRHSMDQQMNEITGDLGTGFSVSVARSWEDEFFGFNLDNTRQVALRTSIVFGTNGGAFQPIKRLTQLGFGGSQGNGNQKVSWIHELDFARALRYIINNPELTGPINIVSPSPTTNRNLMQTMRKSLKIPFGIPMGKKMLELGAKLINTETELILKSRNVVPKKLIDSGFTFQFGILDSAIAQLLEKKR